MLRRERDGQGTAMMRSKKCEIQDCHVDVVESLPSTAVHVPQLPSVLVPSPSPIYLLHKTKYHKVSVA